MRELNPTMFAASLLAVFSVSTASAQVVCFPAAPVVVETRVVQWYTPLLISPLPNEEWREVRWCDLRYHLNGIDYHVDSRGNHYRRGLLSSRQVANHFVEPFCPVTGRRMVRTLSDVPSGASHRFQDGVKTIYVVDGLEYMATWVQVDNTIQTVWCQRQPQLKEVAPSKIAPQVDPAFEQDWQEVQPKQVQPKDEEVLPAPELAPHVGPYFAPPAPSSESKEVPTESKQNSEQPPVIRIDGPVANRQLS